MPCPSRARLTVQESMGREERTGFDQEGHLGAITGDEARQGVLEMQNRFQNVWAEPVAPPEIQD